MLRGAGEMQNKGQCCLAHPCFIEVVQGWGLGEEPLPGECGQT